MFRPPLPERRNYSRKKLEQKNSNIANGAAPHTAAAVIMNAEAFAFSHVNKKIIDKKNAYSKNIKPNVCPRANPQGI